MSAALVGALACSAAPSDEAGGAGGGPNGSSPAGPTDVAPDTAPADADVLTFPPGAVPPDHRGVAIPPVTGDPEKRQKEAPEIDHTKPLLPIEGGTGRISGTVFGPDGPVEGAIVRIERFVGIDFGRLDLVTRKDGTYVAEKLLGGRFKVRAWVTAASITTVTPQLTFIPAKDGAATVDVVMELRTGYVVEGALETATPRVGEPTTFVMLVNQEFVDDTGTVRGRPIPGAPVALHPGAGITVIGPRGSNTDANGWSRFPVMCTAAGVTTMAIESSGILREIVLPECLEPAPVEPTTTVPVATTAAPAPTTAAPRARTTTGLP